MIARIIGTTIKKPTIVCIFSDGVSPLSMILAIKVATAEITIIVKNSFCTILMFPPKIYKMEAVGIETHSIQ